MKNPLQNKKVLITGGSSGLGLKTAEMLSQLGSSVIICAPNIATLRKAVKSTTIKGIVCDVTNPNHLEDLKKEVHDIDILINNAGIWLEGELEDNDYEKISRMIDVNVKGIIYTTKALLPKLKEKNKGIILNVSSTSGIKAKSLQSSYIASKFAIHGFTEALKEDLIKTNISVIGFYPGGMKTELFSKAGNTRDLTTYMDPMDIARTIVFILENADKMLLEHVVITRPKKN